MESVEIEDSRTIQLYKNHESWLSSPHCHITSAVSTTRSCRPYCISSRVLPPSRSRCSAAPALLLCSSSAAHHPPGLQFRGGPGHLFSSSAVVQATSSLVLPRPAFRRAPSPLFSRREADDHRPSPPPSEFG
nr:uncharacterized protein LOC112730345 [Arachis hypogaea]